LHANHYLKSANQFGLELAINICANANHTFDGHLEGLESVGDDVPQDELSGIEI
jgi:hypothetical protein